MSTKAELQAELDRKDKELKALAHKVRRIARKYAQEHGWCDTVELALEEIGVSDRPYIVQYFWYRRWERDGVHSKLKDAIEYAEHENLTTDYVHRVVKIDGRRKTVVWTVNS